MQNRDELHREFVESKLEPEGSEETAPDYQDDGDSKIEMCQHYTWMKKPLCAKSHKAGLKCHCERKDCRDYEPSWHCVQNTTKKDERGRQ